MKKIISLGITSLLMVPIAISAQSVPYGQIDNRNNPMNTPLGTVEWTYNPSPSYSTGDTIRNFFGLQNVSSSQHIGNSGSISIEEATQRAHQNWMIVHCQAVRDGLVWTDPIGIFANAQTCGITNSSLPKFSNILTPIITPTIQPTIIKNENTNSDSANNLSPETMSEFLKFVHAQKKVILENGLTNQIAILSSIQINEFFKKYPHLPDNLKKYTIITLLEASQTAAKNGKNSISLLDLNNVINSRDLDEIKKILLPLVLFGGDIITTSSTGFDAITLIKNDNSVTPTELQLNLFHKNGIMIDLSKYAISLKDAPKWLKIADKNENNILKITINHHEINSQNSIPENIEIILTDKISGNTLKTTTPIRTIENEDSKNVLNFTQKQLQALNEAAIK